VHTIPPAAQAALPVHFEQLHERMDRLETQVAALQEESRQLREENQRLRAQLSQNSTNSSKPPSSDPPSVKRALPKRPSGKKRGGQTGHEAHHRALVPPEKVSESFDIRPEVCRCCGHVLSGDDADPWRHQVAELPPIDPIVTEYRLLCAKCGTKTCGQLPASVPRGAFGPRLQTVLSLLAGAYRLGKRPIQSLTADLFGLSISSGMVSKLERATSASLEAPVEQLRELVRNQNVGADETSWRENHSKAWLWESSHGLYHRVFPWCQGHSRDAQRQLQPRSHLGSLDCLHMDQTPPTLLGAPAVRLPGDDRPGELRQRDRQVAA